MRNLAIAAVAVATASAALASNTAHKVNYQLVRDCGAGQSNVNWVSLPYFFNPDGDFNNPSPVAKDWCEDLNRAPLNADVVLNVTRFDTATDTFQTKACINTLPGFALVPGAAYGVVLNPAQPSPTTVDIVGAHDDDFRAGGPSRIDILFRPGLSSLNWISVPPHVRGTTLQDLCVLANGGPGMTTPVLNVQQFNSCEDTFATKSCVNGLPGPAIEPGRGYGFTPGGMTDQQIQLDVY